MAGRNMEVAEAGHTGASVPPSPFVETTQWKALNCHGSAFVGTLRHL